MVTLRDIAKLADVSVGTVSRVINDLDKVKPETREKIRSIIKKEDMNVTRMQLNLGEEERE